MAEIRLLTKQSPVVRQHDPATDDIRFRSMGVGAAASGTTGVINMPTPSAAPVAAGQIGMSADGTIQLFVGGAVVTVLSSGGAGLTAHAALRQLIHLAENGPMEAWPTGVFRNITPSGSYFPTAVTWYTDNTATTKILEKLLTRDGLQRATTIQWKMYAADGITVLATITDTVTYSGYAEIDRTRAIA